MINRSALTFWCDKETKAEAAHILDLCEKALYDGTVEITPFLSQAMSDWLEALLLKSDLAFVSWGGFDDAERLRVAVSADWNDIGKDDTGIALLQALPHQKEAVLHHRDALGSLIGLGLKREVIGDIRRAQAGIVVAVTEQIQEYIIQNWNSVGRERITVSAAGDGNTILPVAGTEKRIVTASARLDCLGSAGFGVSRSDIQDLIKQGKLKKNDLIMTKPEAEVKAGDILSLRGKGRLKVLNEAGGTRKGKLAWTIFMYQDKRNTP